MKLKNHMLALFTILTSAATLVFAQSRQRPPDAGGAACGLLSCGVFGIVYILIMVGMVAGFVAITVFIIKWIRKDATARGMANADTVKWWGLLGLMGLLIYVLTRPDGGGMPPRNQPPPPPSY